MREGDSIGKAALPSNRLHPVTTIAVSDCIVLHVSRPALMTELTRDGRRFRRVMASLRRICI